ncbi:NUMOD4 motif-containing HNH endonuclease [Nocardia thailandica]|uniref:NUMOD4 motif-containing HNH endonuclease n=1 Tax=Nocardia thailandica TaxID=257275 RepID=UPI000A04E7D5|nr:NUMOD4 motif-containing HNH endonuclease [Nocardia thailandica]
MTTSETWLPVVGYEGQYEVSDAGRVRSLDRLVRCRGGALRTSRGQILAPIGINALGHVSVHLASRGKSTATLVHRIVAIAFLGGPFEGMEVCHNDGDPRNNAVSNLRWDSHSENQRDRRRHGTDHNVNKRECPRGHPLEHPNLVMALWKKKGGRTCLACARARCRVWHHPELDFEAVADDYYRAISATNPRKAA